MTKAGDSFVAEDFFRLHRGDLALWTTASLIVVAGLIGGYWAYKTYVPAEVLSGPPAGAMTVEFAEFAVSPVTEELDVPEGEASAASEEVAPSEAEPDPEAEPIEEPEPVVEAEAEPEEVVEPEPVVEPEFVEPQEVTETAEAETLPEPEPVVEPTSEPEPVEEAVPEPVEPILDVPEVEVPEPPVVIERRVAAAEPVVEPPVVEPPAVEPEPVPEEPVVEPVDPTLPMPVAMPQRVADIRAETPPTKFEPPVRRTAPPPQAATQAAAPKPAAQQAAQAAAPQQVLSAAPSASQVDNWQASVARHIAQRQRYPASARRRGETGDVFVQFTIDAAGQVRSVSITGSTGHASLDQAALDLIYASSPLPRPPEGIPPSRMTIGMPIGYWLDR